MSYLNQRYNNLLSSLVGSSIPTKILPPVEQQNKDIPTPNQQALNMIICGTGLETFRFINKQEYFKRCFDLLMVSQTLINNFKGKVFIRDPNIQVKKEFSYLIAPAAKALEGFLLAVAFYKGMINQDDIDNGVPIGEVYHDVKNQPAKAKFYVLKQKDRSMVDKIYSDWGRYRNKTLHYDPDYFIDRVDEAQKILNQIYETFRLTYQIFIGLPDTYNP